MAGSDRGVTDRAHRKETDGADRRVTDGADRETADGRRDIETKGSAIDDSDDEATADEPAMSRDSAVSRSVSRIALGTGSVGIITSLAGCADGFELGGDPPDDSDDSDGDDSEDGDDSPENGTDDDDTATDDGPGTDTDSNRAIGRGVRLRHPGAVVIGDSSAAEIASRGPDEVRSQSPIYAPTFETTSTRTAKTDLRRIDPDAALDGVASIPLYTWRFTDVDDGRHVGPMAEAFSEHVLDEDPAESIATVDADGMILASIGALAEKISQSNDRLRTELETLDERIAVLESRIVRLQTE